VIDETDMRTARMTKWGFAGLLIFAGGMFFHSQWRDGMPAGDVAVCAAAALLGFGLLLNLLVARWLALGVCFLLIGAAIVLPVLRFLLQPPGTSPGAVFANALFAVFMITFGGIGYRALSYFRSQLGRREYAGTGEREARLGREGSSAVVLSAGVWLLFFVATWFAGMRLPTQLVVTRDAEADSARELAQQRAQSDARRPVSRNDINGPDIAPLGLCRGGDTQVVLAYENRGRAVRSGNFDVTYTDKWWDPRSRATAPAQLPSPGSVGFVGLGIIGSIGGEDEQNALVQVRLDSGDDIRESDENNNDPDYSLSQVSFTNLPPCEDLQSVQR
jgi:hypothetical protein